MQNRTGLIYQSLLCNSFIAMLTSISLCNVRPPPAAPVARTHPELKPLWRVRAGVPNAVPEHRDLFYRERRQQLYSAGTLLTAYMVHILPATIVAELLYCYIVYYATGLYPDQIRFWIFTSSCIAAYIFGELVGIFFVRLPTRLARAPPARSRRVSRPRVSEGCGGRALDVAVLLDHDRQLVECTVPHRGIPDGKRVLPIVRSHARVCAVHQLRQRLQVLDRGKRERAFCPLRRA